MEVELTCREKDVLGLLVQGYSNKKIAMSLCISDFTVRDHGRLQELSATRLLN
ncbi:hypothetical protein GHO26_12195 [Pseudomonas helleri]|nr:hypothetical protein [Pseudomonas helleri]